MLPVRVNNGLPRGVNGSLGGRPCQFNMIYRLEVARVSCVYERLGI